MKVGLVGGGGGDHSRNYHISIGCFAWFAPTAVLTTILHTPEEGNPT